MAILTIVASSASASNLSIAVMINTKGLRLLENFHILLTPVCLTECISYRGESFYPGVNNLSYGGSGKVSSAGIERMVADLEKQWVPPLGS